MIPTGFAEVRWSGLHPKLTCFDRVGGLNKPDRYWKDATMRSGILESATSCG